jgi:hypothetical protein
MRGADTTTNNMIGPTSIPPTTTVTSGSLNLTADPGRDRRRHEADATMTRLQTRQGHSRQLAAP